MSVSASVSVPKQAPGPPSARTVHEGGPGISLLGALLLTLVPVLVLLLALVLRVLLTLVLTLLAAAVTLLDLVAGRADLLVEAVIRAVLGELLALLEGFVSLLRVVLGKLLGLLDLVRPLAHEIASFARLLPFLSPVSRP